MILLINHSPILQILQICANLWPQKPKDCNICVADVITCCCDMQIFCVFSSLVGIRPTQVVVIDINHRTKSGLTTRKLACKFACEHLGRLSSVRIRVHRGARATAEAGGAMWAMRGPDARGCVTPVRSAVSVVGRTIAQQEEGNINTQISASTWPRRQRNDVDVEKCGCLMLRETRDSFRAANERVDWQLLRPH